MSKDLNEYTLEEFQEMVQFKPKKPFRWVIIVPMDDVHDSGYRCMKFIVGDGYDIYGVIYAGSDVVNPNGIGNYGKNWELTSVTSRGLVPYLGLSLDCLVESKCVRIMMSKPCELDSFIGSNFVFYAKEEN